MNVKVARLATTTLAGLCGVLLLLFIAQYAGLGRGYHWSASTDAGAHAVAGTIDSRPVQMPPLTAFADIDAHPLFNEDREPTPADANEGDDATPEINPLNVALTGVILDEANHVRIAMLQDKASNQAVALKVGMPLEGDQGSWTLVELKPRLAVFRSAANETAEVELETAAPAHPPKAAGGRPSPAQNKRPTPGQAATGQNSSNDLARRIEDRRRQMREDAERLRKAQPARPAQPKK